MSSNPTIPKDASADSGAQRAASAVQGPAPSDAQSDVVVVMARAPDGPAESIKSRLSPAIPDVGTRVALYRALLADTLRAARGVQGIGVQVAYVPEGGERGFDALGVAAQDRFPQRGHDLGMRQQHVFEDVFARGATRVVVVGSDLPALPGGVLEAAFAVLRRLPAAVVLGPAEDGGYYLIGMARAETHEPAAAGCPPMSIPDVFTGVRWSTAHALADVVAAAERASRTVVRLDPWFDVDDRAGLARAREVLTDPAAAARAPMTAAWLAATSGRVVPPVP